MILDVQTEFSLAQAVATAVSTHTIDLGPGAGRDIGVGQAVYLVLTTPTALAGTSPTVTVVLQTSTAVAMSAPVTILTTVALTAADFAAGPIVIPLPGGSLRALRLSYTAGGTVTGGTITAGLQLDATRWKSYPRNYVV